MRVNAFVLLLLLPLFWGQAAISSQNSSTPAAEVEDDNIPFTKIEKRGTRNYVVGTISINAQPENVWDVLVDYSKAPEVFKNLKLCEVVESKGRVKLVRQVVRTGLPFEFDYVVALIEDKPYRIEWSRESGSLREVTGSWQLEPIESGEKTKITYSIFIDGGFCLPPWLLNPQIKNYLPVILNSLRRKVESTRASKKISVSSVSKTVLV